MRIIFNRTLAIILTAGTLTAGSGVAAAQEASTKEARQMDNKRIVDAAFARWANGGGGFFDEMLSADVVWTIKGSGPSAGTYQGRQNFVARAVQPFASRLSSPVRPVSYRLWADGDHVIIQWDGEGVAGDGAPYRNSYAWIFRMAGGKAVEVTAFLDLVPYDDVLRRVPAPAGQGG